MKKIMKKIIEKIISIIVLLSVLFVDISPISVEAATELKQINIILNVGEKKSLDTYAVGNSWYGPLGKLTIGDSSIVGVECQYNKKKDEWDNDIVGLRPGKTTVIRWHHNNTYLKFNITVKRAVMDSITSYFGLEKLKSQDDNYYEPKLTDKTAQDILKNLNLEQCNSDRQRIIEVSKYFYENVTLDEDELLNINCWPYSALVSKKAHGGINYASELLLQNLGFDINYSNDYQFRPTYHIVLEGVEYHYNLYDSLVNYFLGSESYNYRYAGEGTYTSETGEILQGSLYYNELGEIDESLIIQYTYDVNNYILHDDFDYVSVKRKTHLPAWLIGNETQQQVLQKGDTKALPDDRLSSNVYSSDESIVKIEDNKIVGVKDGIAIVYRYDDTYCDAFYVVVDKKPNSKKLSVNYKSDGKKYSSYKTSDIATNRKIINENPYRRKETWKKSVLYKLEPALNGGKLQTSYKDGYIKAYVIDADGTKQEIFDDTDYIEE